MLSKLEAGTGDRAALYGRQLATRAHVCGSPRGPELRGVCHAGYSYGADVGCCA